MNNNIIFELINFANHLDKKRLYREADYIDLIIKGAGVDSDEDEDIDYEETGETPPRAPLSRDDYITALCTLSKVRNERSEDLRANNEKLQKLKDDQAPFEKIRRRLDVIRYIIREERTYNREIGRLLAKANRTFNLNIDDIEKGCPEFSRFYKKQD